MGRVIQLKNGEILTINNNNIYATLADTIYEYLGIDACNLFMEYVDKLTDERDEAISICQCGGEGCHED